jgi:hypothetical protein
MKIRGNYFLCLLVLLFFAASIQAHEVVLRNGKVVKGTVVSEDDSMIVIQDADGLRINIKKANVDAEKTKAANPPAAKPVDPVEPAKPVSAAPKAKQEVRKPAKKLTEEDLKKLREKYDLGEGTFKEGAAEESESSENTEEAQTDDFSATSESEWQAESARHRERVKAAEERYTRLAQECEELKKITVQTHTLVDEQGNELQMTETREKVCEMADSARATLEEERASQNEFMNEAREKAIPPGWLRDQEGNDPNE